jgi:hypothetical protein
VTLKRCTKCGKDYPATGEHFAPDRRKVNGLQAACRICKRAAHRDRRKRKIAEGHPCSVDGCVRPAVCAGYCEFHHLRKCRGIPLDAVKRGSEDPKFDLVSSGLAYYDGAADEDAVHANARRFGYWAQKHRHRPSAPRHLVQRGNPRVLVFDAIDRLAEADSDEEYAAWEAVLCQYALRYTSTEWRGNDARAT